MDIMSFVVGSMVVLVAVAVGAGVVILMHHLDMHDKSAQKREENTVYVQSSSPKHAQLLPPTFKEPSVPSSASSSMPARTPSVPVTRATTQGIPVDVTFDDSTAEQARGGN